MLWVISHRCMKPYVESHHLHIFVTLAATLNMSQAARELGLTPSAISHALKLLEADLGCRIFDRSPQHMTLLPTGRSLLPEAVAILEQMQRIRNKAEASFVEQDTGIRLSCPPILAPHLRASVGQKFRARYPDCLVQFEECEPAKAETYLDDGRLDLVITQDMPRSNSLEFRLLAREEFLLSMNARHEWANKRRIPVTEILVRKLFVPNCGNETLEWIRAYFQQAHPAVEPFVEVSTQEAIQQLLTQNSGLAIMPRWQVNDQLKRSVVTQIPLGSKPLKRNWFLVHSTARKLSFHETLLVNMCKGAMRELMQT